jgi:tetratricopeptide (TPR) repeat protein
VYGLGAILYTLLTDKASIKRNNDTLEERERAIADILAGKFPRPREVKPYISASLEKICLKAMETKPTERYESARDLAKDIKHWLADEPVSVCPESRSQLLARWARRNRPWVQASAAALLLVAVVATILARSEQAAKVEAVANFQMARDAIYQIMDLVGSRLAYVRGTEELAREGLIFSERFLRAQPRDFGVRFDRARILRVTANIGRLNGHFRESLALYQEASNLLRQLSKEVPRSHSILDERVLDSIDMGELVRMAGRPGESKAYFQLALDLLDASARPDESASQRRLRAIALVHLASAYNETGGHEQARSCGIQAIELLDPLAGKGVDHPDVALVLLMAHHQFGVAERRLKNGQESKRQLDLAIKRAESLLEAHYDSPTVKHALACALNDRGELLASDPTFQTSGEDMFKQSGLILCALVNEYPHIPQFNRDLARSYNGIGSARLALGLEKLEKDPKNAKSLLKRALSDCDEARKLLVELLRSRRLFDYHSCLSQTMANLSRISAALGDADSARLQMEQSLEERRKGIEANRESRIDLELPEKTDGDRASLK